MIESFFQKLGLEQKETKVMMSVLRLGAQPASVIAKHVRMDRTTTYRILKNLCGKKLLTESNQKGITVFYIEKVEDIRRFLEKEEERIHELTEELENLSPQISAMRSNIQELPRIQIYDGFERLETFYRDVIDRAREQGLLIIRILGSNTFSQKLEQRELGDLIRNFEKEMARYAIEADVLIAQGNLTREWLTPLNSLKAMANLPAAGGATNVILVGESVFMVSFRDFPVGIQIDHPDMAQTMHFLFDVSRGKLS